MLVRNVGRLPTKLHDVVTQDRGNINVMYVIVMHKCGSFNGFVLLYNRCQLCSLPHNTTCDWLEHYQQLPPCVVAWYITVVSSLQACAGRRSHCLSAQLAAVTYMRRIKKVNRFRV